MAAALMSKLFLHWPGRLCLTPVCRLATRSSYFVIDSVSKKRKATALLSEKNLRESDHKHNRDLRRYLPISWLALEALYLSSNSSTVNCVGRVETAKVHRVLVKRNTNRASCHFRSLFVIKERKLRRKKATLLRNSRVDKAKRKLVLDSEDKKKPRS